MLEEQKKDNKKHWGNPIDDWIYRNEEYKE